MTEFSVGDTVVLKGFDRQMAVIKTERVEGGKMSSSVQGGILCMWFSSKEDCYKKQAFPAAALEKTTE
jgi:uncharacterized protein YodC (DUF2158 family)